MPERRQFHNFPWSAPSVTSRGMLRQKVSVVLPVYNMGKYLRPAIESVLTQAGIPLELIVVNDGSTDSTAEILKEYEGRAQITIIHQANAGISRALNKGFSLSSGEFLTWISADNIYLEGALKRMAGFLRANPAVALVYANVQLIDEHGKKLEGSSYRKQDQNSRDSSVLLLPLNSGTLWEINDNFVNACFMYRRDVCDFLGGYSELRGLEDYDYWLRLSLLGDIAHLDGDEVLYQYRLHRGSLTSELSSSDLLEKQKQIVRRAHACHALLECSFDLEIDAGEQDVEGADMRMIAAALELSRHRVIPLCRAGEPGKPKNTPGGGASIARLGVRRISFSAGLAAYCDETIVSERRAVLSREILFMRPASLRVCTGMHELYLRFHTFGVQEPLLVLRRDESPTGSRQGFIALPPLSVPSLFRRARDTSYGAVTPVRGGGATFLLFAPHSGVNGDSASGSEADWCFGTLRDLVSSYAIHTFVILCVTVAGRKAADSLNLSLERNENLRIIDLSEKQSAYTVGGSLKEDFDPYSLAASIMYCLSSCDAVLSLRPSLSHIRAQLELRTEAALAAYAGKSIVAVTQEDIHLPVCSFAGEEILFPGPSLLPGILDAPHLYCCIYSPKVKGIKAFRREGAAAYPSLNELLSSSAERPDVSSLEQWIELQSPLSFARRLSALLLQACP